MISSLGRVKIKREIEKLNLNDRIVAYIPSYTACPDCGFDATGRSAKDISCATCGGEGRLATWASTYLLCRVSWTDVGRPRYTGAVASTELGDATFEVGMAYKVLIERLRDEEGAYVEVDGRKLRVVSVNVNRIEGTTNVVARCEIIHD
jgi:hypothetical protein